MRERPRADGGFVDRATDREVSVVAAVVAAGSEKAAAHRLGLSHSTIKHHLANARTKVGATTTAQLVWILAARLTEVEAGANADDDPSARCEPLSVRRRDEKVMERRRQQLRRRRVCRMPLAGQDR